MLLPKHLESIMAAPDPEDAGVLFSLFFFSWCRGHVDTEGRFTNPEVWTKGTCLAVLLKA